MSEYQSINDLIFDAAQAQTTVALPKDLSECLTVLWCKAAGLPLQGMEPAEQARIRNYFSNLVFDSQ